VSHLSTLKLNQYRYGELPPEEMAAARAHLSDCGRCLARLQAQQANRQAFVVEPVPQAIQDAARDTPANTPRNWLRWAAPAIAAAALLLLVPMLNLDQNPAPVGPSADEIRTKGEGILLEAWLDTRDGPRLLETGALVSPGDVLQLKYAAEGRPWVSFGGVDQQGVVEVYGIFASEGLEIERAPFALELDRTPGTQEILAVFTWERPSESQIHASISNRRAPDDGVLRSLTFTKQ
jgi:hypothetical protein